NGRLEAFRWTDSGRVMLGIIPGGSLSVATGVSGDGSVVVGVGDSQAWRWTSSTGIVGMGDLPPDNTLASQATAVSSDGRKMVGQGTSTVPEAFRWTAGEGFVGLGDLPGGGVTSSLALGVSANGAVIVGTGESDLGSQAFRWTAAGMLGLPLLPSGEVPTEAYGVSADGSIVVGTSRYTDVAFIWDPVHGTRSLQQVLAQDYGLDLTGWTLQVARAL